MAITTGFDRKGRLHLTGVTSDLLNHLTRDFGNEVESLTVKQGEERHTLDVVVRFDLSKSGAQVADAMLRVVMAAYDISDMKEWVQRLPGLA